MFMGHENATLMVAKYDEKLLLSLLMEANKFLMLNKVETTSNIHSKGDSEGLFHTSTIADAYKDIVSKELIGFWWVPINVEGCKCVLYWWCKESTSF